MFFIPIYRYILAIVFSILVSMTSWAQNPTLLSSVDSNCTLHLVLVDTTGQPVSNHPPYIFTVGNSNITSNSLAMINLDVSTFANNTYTITVMDGLQNIYNGVITVGCGQPAGLILTDSVVEASACNVCDATAIITVQNSNNLITFNWSDGVVQVDSMPVQRNNLCPGVYTVVATDGVFSGSILVEIGCFNGTNPQVAFCVSNFSRILGSGGMTTLVPDDLSATIINTSTESYIVDALGNISNYKTLTCNDLGYNNLTLLLIDTLLQTSSTCQVVVEIEDSLGMCNGQNSNNFEIIGTISNASSCGVCNGVFFLQTVFDTVQNIAMPQPYTYLWNDGLTIGPTRASLCPNQLYTLTITDAVGNSYIKDIIIGCNNPVGNPCVDSSRIIQNLTCPNVYAPVCGCDNITYMNSCEAEYKNGINTWTQGVCNASPMTLLINTTPDNLCDTITSCTGTASIVAVGGVAPHTISWSNFLYTTFSVTGICSGSYTVTVTDANGAVATGVVVVGITGCVWPGDTDNNTVANNYDLLPIALMYNDVGPARQNATITWTPQTATDWDTMSINNLPDRKHIDCDGNGFIDSVDVVAIAQNYGRSYYRTTNSLFGPIPFFVESATTIPGDTLALAIHLGDQFNSVTNAYAVAFTINYDPNLVEPSVSANFDTSWLGIDLLEIQENFYSTGQLEVAIGRKNKFPISGFGQIGTVAFTIKDDVLIGKTQQDSVDVPFTISNIRLIDEYNVEIGTNPQTGITRVVEIVNIHYINNELDVILFPNPAETTLNIQTKLATIEAIQLFTATGQLVKNIQNLNTNLHSISLEDLAKGIYFISVQTDKGVYNNRLMVR